VSAGINKEVGEDSAARRDSNVFSRLPRVRGWLVAAADARSAGRARTFSVEQREAADAHLQPQRSFLPQIVFVLMYSLHRRIPTRPADKLEAQTADTMPLEPPQHNRRSGDRAKGVLGRFHRSPNAT
jgi:hypothetical protein